MRADGVLRRKRRHIMLNLSRAVWHAREAVMGSGLQRLSIGEARPSTAEALLSGAPKDRALRPSGLDPAITTLCRVIDEFPGIATTGGGQGYVDGHRPGEPWD